MLYYKSKKFKEKRIKGVSIMLEQKYFTKDEIIETLENAKGYDVPDFDGLFEAMFNSDDYIVYAYEAAKALETFKNDEKLDGYKTELDGAFGAIELVKRYESDQFGEVSTILEDPRILANMVEYIRGEHLFDKVLNEAELDMDSETTQENIDKFIEAVKTL